MTRKIEPTLANKTIFVLLSALVVFTALAYGTVHQPVIALFYLAVTAIAVLWGADALRTGALVFHRSPLQIPLLGAVVYALIQIVPFGSLAETAGLSGIPRTISLEPFWTQMFALHLFALLLFFSVSLVYLDSAARLRKMTALITIFGFAFAFFAILQSFLSPTKIYGLYETSFAQPFGSFVNRHNFAAYMEMTIAVPLGLIFVGAVPRDKKLLYATAIGLMGIALLLSGSRGGLVSMVAAVFFLALITSRTRSANQVALKIVFAAVLIATIVAGAFFIGGESSLTRFAETAVSSDVSTNRTYIWSVTLEVIKNNLPFGAGIGAFASAYTPYDTMNGTERVEQAHNDYLQILADAGLVGLLLAAFFIYLLFRTGLKNAGTENIFRRGVAVGALAGCFAILVHSLFDFVLHTTAVTVMFLTLVALVVASGREYADDEHLYERKHKKKASITPIGQKRRRDETGAAQIEN
jgi:O-antigen ligase